MWAWALAAALALAVPAVLHLGRLSYSLYLWHYPVIELSSAWLGPGYRADVVGLTLQQAEARFKPHKLEVGAVEQVFSQKPEGTVISRGF